MLTPATGHCPECGASILGEDAVRIGRRSPSMAGQIVAAAVLLGGMGCFGVGAADWWKHFDGTPYASFSTLESRITSSDPSLRRRSVDELLRRIKARTLTAGEGAHLADTVLKLQSRASDWDTRWGDLIETEQATAHGAILPPEKWAEYLARAMQLDLAVRPRVSQGGPVPVRATCDLRAGSFAARDVPFAPRVELSVGGLKGDWKADARTSGGYPRLAWTFLWQPGAPGGAAALPKGPQTLEANFTLRALPEHGDVTLQKQFKLAVDIVAGSSTTLHAPSDDDRALMNEAVEWRVAENSALAPGAAGNLGRLRIVAPPYSCAFRVVLQQANHEWPIGRFMVQSGDIANVPLTLPKTGAGNRPEPGAATIVCIPDPDLPGGTVDVMEIWGAELRQKITLGQF
jgi:hypothetical protein